MNYLKKGRLLTGWEEGLKLLTQYKYRGLLECYCYDINTRKSVHCKATVHKVRLESNCTPSRPSQFYCRWTLIWRSFNRDGQIFRKVSISHICLFTKATVKRITKTCKLVCSCCETSWMPMLRVWPPTFKAVLQQIRLSQVACWVLTSDWIKLRRSHTIQGSYVTCSKTSLPWTGRRATCTDFVAKSKTTFYFMQQMFATGKNLNCCRTAVWRRPVVKRAT